MTGIRIRCRAKVTIGGVTRQWGCGRVLVNGAWVQQRSARGASGGALASKIISAVAVGPTQRVVTIEVGPVGARTWLTLGVTAQTITCLHSEVVDAALDADRLQAIAGASTQS